MAYDALRRAHGEALTAYKAYLRVLQLAAKEIESGVGAVLRVLLEGKEPITAESVEALLEAGYHDKRAADELNSRGYRDSKGEPFFRDRIAKIRDRLNIASCPDRQCAKLRKRGYVTGAELAAALQVPEHKVYCCARKGRGIEHRRIKVGKRYYGMYKVVAEGGREPQGKAQLP